MPAVTARYTSKEEKANSFTHGLGTILAVYGTWVLTSYCSDSWRMLSCIVFGTSMIALYAASTLYHCISQPRIKSIFRTFDHIGILLLIAGTYTPFTLITLKGSWGWSIFGTVWFLALTGAVIELSKLRHKRKISIALYVAMGWTIIVAIKPLMSHLHHGGFLLLLLGGLTYTGGIVFYLWRQLPYHHAIWHLFVLLGSAFHFFAILLYVIPDTVLL